jgi:hypothetical protein
MLTVSFTPTTTFGRIDVRLGFNTDQIDSDSYVYWDDMSVLYPAGVVLDLGGFDVWIDGMPATPSISTSISAADVWSVSTAGLTSSGTTGKKLVDNLTTGKFIGLK